MTVEVTERRTSLKISNPIEEFGWGMRKRREIEC